VKSGERKTVVNGGTDPVSSTGHLLYGLGGIVFAVASIPRARK
jgi:hypothetical protein